MHTTEWDRDLMRDTLQQIMMRADLTQSAVGRLAGRDRTMANRWLKGHHQPNYEAATRFAGAVIESHPELTSLVRVFLAAAGYPPSPGAEGPTPPIADDALQNSEQIIAALRELAREQEKSIGDILVERGLATPEELTLSEEKRGDQYVRDILGSNLPEDTKNNVLLHYVGRRRHYFRQEGLIDGPQEK